MRSNDVPASLSGEERHCLGVGATVKAERPYTEAEEMSKSLKEYGPSVRRLARSYRNGREPK